MLTVRDKYKEALFACWTSAARSTASNHWLASKKPTYVTGDWEMTTRYTPDQAILANVTSSALPT